jgi:hypothetical protein
MKKIVSKTGSRALSLNKTTVKDLSNEQLHAVPGGASRIGCTYTGCHIFNSCFCNQ